MGAGRGGAVAGIALGTDRGRVVVVDTALLGRSHSSVGRRPREKDMSPAPGARDVVVVASPRTLFFTFSVRRTFSDERHSAQLPSTGEERRTNEERLVDRPRFRCDRVAARRSFSPTRAKFDWQSLVQRRAFPRKGTRLAATRGHHKDARERRATRSGASNLRTSHAGRVRSESLAHGASRRPGSAVSGPHVLARARNAGKARGSRVGVSARDARRDPRAGYAAAERVDGFS